MGLGEHLLVGRLRNGDREACRELVRRHHRSVYGYLRRLGADAANAEDLTQETYAKAWARIGTLRRSTSLRPWLLAIARNEFFQWARGARPEVAVDERLSGAPPSELETESGLIDAERRDALRRAVSALEPVLRETVALHYFQGLSQREVGTVLSIPRGTVKSRINRALGRLRELLDVKETDYGTRRSGEALAGDS